MTSLGGLQNIFLAAQPASESASSMVLRFLGDLGRWIVGNFGAVIAETLKAVLILLIGWIAAAMIRRLTASILGLFRFDEFCNRLGLSSILERAGVHTPPSKILGQFSFFIVLIIFIVAIADLLEIKTISDLLANFLGYLPNLVKSFAVLMVGIFLGTYVGRLVHIAASAADIEEAHLLRRLVSALIIGVAVVMALVQLEIAHEIVIGAFLITLSAVGLALALAFGLGSRDIARDFMEDIITRKEKTPKKRSRR